MTNAPLLLREMRIMPPARSWPAGYPFDLPLVQALPTLDFTAPVTFFAGENGSGKSTLLEARSHGEGFLDFFHARFVPAGLYLLDEPEAPLSPLRQLSLLTLLMEMVAQQAQFIIATHSPILMAFPGAVIYTFTALPANLAQGDAEPRQGLIERVAFDDVEHVKITRDFLANPQRFLRHLL